MNLYALKLRPASYKGVSFSVDESEYTAGRRNVLHQYPNRDTPFVEDLGRASRNYSLTAIIVGLDYIERTKRLMQALETEGGGRLIHPWLGELTVTPVSVGTAQFNKSLGLATVSLSFVESGELIAPSGGVSVLATLRSRVDALLETIADEFEKAIDIDGVQDIVSSATADAWGVARDVFANDTFLKTLGVSNAILSVPTELMMLNPKGFAQSIISASGLNAFTGVFNDWMGVSSNLARSSRSKALSASGGSFVAGSSQDKIQKNKSAVFDMTRGIMLAQSSGAASMIGEQAQSTSGSVVSYDSIVEARDILMDALDKESIETTSGELAEQLDGLRSSVYHALTELARSNARIIHIATPPNTPLVVAAYDQYEDAERADELARINSIRNIGFSPFGGLKALSE